MGRYSCKTEDSSKTARARGSHLRVHYKHMREVAHTIKGMSVKVAKKFLEDVLAKKRAVPFTMFTGGIGRHAQGKLMNAPGDKCRWPQKATRIILNLLLNAESNAELKGLDAEELKIVHIQANRAPKQRRRTYRAHGRINAYMSSPAHIELVLGEEEEKVKKGDGEGEGKTMKLSRKQLAQRRLKQGGGLEA